MIFTNLAPNTERDDALLALRLIVTPWGWKKRRGAADRLARMVADRVHAPQGYVFDSGRTALYEILRAAGIGHGDEVLVQAYTCVAVIGPILWAGATPVFVDCDETLTMAPEDLKRKHAPRAKAIIIQHTFGMPARLIDVISFAKAHSLISIEDCAHSLGATYQGQPLGSFGDAAFFSLGRDKVISSVFGGIATARNERIAAGLAAAAKQQPTPSTRWILQQLLHPLLMYVGKNTYELGGKLLIALAKKLQLTSRAVEPIEKTGGRRPGSGTTLAEPLALLALHQLRKLDRFAIHRRTIARQYDTSLARLSLPTQETTDATGALWLRYTIWGPEAQAISALAAKRGIRLGDWYTTPIAPSGVDYQRIGYQMGSCPNAERISGTTINLPTDIHITTRDVERIISCIYDAVSPR